MFICLFLVWYEFPFRVALGRELSSAPSPWARRVKKQSENGRARIIIDLCLKDSRQFLEVTINIRSEKLLIFEGLDNHDILSNSPEAASGMLHGSE